MALGFNFWIYYPVILRELQSCFNYVRKPLELLAIVRLIYLEIVTLNFEACWLSHENLEILNMTKGTY